MPYVNIMNNAYNGYKMALLNPREPTLYIKLQPTTKKQTRIRVCFSAQGKGSADSKKVYLFGKPCFLQ